MQLVVMLSCACMHAGRGVLMEFYAAWCPACKHFQPHYDKVAEYFHGTPRPKPEVYVARVDCATEVSITLRTSPTSVRAPTPDTCFICHIMLHASQAL